MPDDITVVGFEDLPMARHTEPPLTTIRRPMREMGETAARRLLAHLARQEGRPGEPVVLPTELIVRDPGAMLLRTAGRAA